MKFLPAALAGLLLTLSLAAPVSAADTAKPADMKAAANPADEIIYRANLGRADDVLLLIKQGASPDAKDEHGTPLLALAASRKDKEGLNVVKALLASHATLNGRDAQGRTALFYAAKQGNMDTLKFLLTSGIDYYATDNNGDIARNIAHASGHEEIVTALDDFVKGQSAAVNEQYKKVNDALKDRYKALEDAQKKAVEDAKKATAAPLPVADVPPSAQSTGPATPPAPTPTAEETAAKAAAQEADEKQKQQNKAHMAKQLAFQSCAFQYWSFCQDSGQSTELSEEALLDEIKTHRDQATDTGNDMITQKLSDANIVNKIAEAANQRVFAALNSMPSKAYRHEYNVGKKDDMEKRCRVVADEWDSDAPIPSSEPPKSTYVAPPKGSGQPAQGVPFSQGTTGRPFTMPHSGR